MEEFKFKLEQSTCSIARFESTETALNLCDNVKKEDLECLHDDKTRLEDLEQLYAGHEVKHELALGPEVLQRCQPLAVSTSNDFSDGSTFCQQNIQMEFCCETLLNHPRSFSSPHCGKQGKDGRERILRTCADTADESPVLTRSEHGCVFDNLTPTAPQDNKDNKYKRCQKPHSNHVYDRAVSCEKEMRTHPHAEEQPSSFIVSKKTHFCDIYYKTSKSSTLQRHTRLHTGRKPYSCDSCNKTFSQRSKLIQHTRVHTSEKPFSGDSCNKTFSQKSQLIQHTRLHTREKPYSCDSCNKTFSQRSTLIQHTRLHTGEKPNSCDLCNKTFSKKSNLKQHTRLHSGEKPYSCDSCNKTFSKKSNLKQHTRLHSGEKPYSCDLCSKTFSKNSNLKRHTRLHSGEKPYSCDLCSKTFSQKRSLIKHTRLHTGEKSYSCDLCKKNIFLRKQSYTAYTSSH